MNFEPKLDVLFACCESLNSLDPADKKWVLSRLARIKAAAAGGQGAPQRVDRHSKPAKDRVIVPFPGGAGDFVKVFAKAHPKTEDQKILLAAWLLFGKARQNFKGRQISRSLKLTGDSVNSVSVCLGRLRKRKPALVVKVGANGNRRQSHKIYGLTDEGAKRAQMLLDFSNDE